MKRAVFYLRVSTQDQTTANQERELREIAGRMGCDVVKVYKDHGISGTKGRDKRPAIDKHLARGGRKWHKNAGPGPGTPSVRHRPLIFFWSSENLLRAALVARRQRLKDGRGADLENAVS